MTKRKKRKKTAKWKTATATNPYRSNLTQRIGAIEEQLGSMLANVDLLTERQIIKSPFPIKKVMRNGRPMFQDGTTTCALCNGLKRPEHLSPKGACFDCLRDELVAVTTGKMAASR